MAATQAALPISLIATPRSSFLTCGPDEHIREVIGRYAEYDHIPVTENGHAEGRVLGLLNAHRFREPNSDCSVGKLYDPLSEEHLIGSDVPIIDFVWQAPERDCRLLVSGKSISGLVTLSDLQALPVRAALFALVTRLEILMADQIKKQFGGGDAWARKLSDDRREKLRKQIRLAKRGDAFIDALLCTEFADKVTIIAKSVDLPVSRKKFERELGSAQSLRNALAHANEYASSRAAALKACARVRTVCRWIEHFEVSGHGSRIEADRA